MLPEQIRAIEYLTRKGTNSPVRTVHEQLNRAFQAVEQSFDAVAHRDRYRPPAEGRWSAHEILDHLVLSHGPAVSQLETLLSSSSPTTGAIPADLHRDSSERPAWDELRSHLADIHGGFRSLLANASDELSLQPKVAVEMVVKVGAEAKHWVEYLDWKAFVQAIRVHTLEHEQQLKRTVAVGGQAG